MRTLVETLFSAQSKLLNPALAPADRTALLDQLHVQVPAPVLSHFLRPLGRNRPSVAYVRHGVCGECHLRVASGIVAALAHPQDIYLCDNCGCYLLLAPDEFAAFHPAEPPAVEASAPTRRRRATIALPVLAATA